MTRLDRMSGSSGPADDAVQHPVPEMPPAEDSSRLTPARIALQSITIGDLVGFLFKVLIAGIVVAFPFAVAAFIIMALAGRP